jgi:GNAT superfamily N-acetyltransferase
MSIIKRIKWEQILKVWRDSLWPGRASKIKPTNGIIFMGGYDKKIEDNIPSFFGAFEGEKCVGVNSGFLTGENMYRSRGLYVFPNYRRAGVATKLLEETQRQALLEGAKMIWSMPRETALDVYLKFGFCKKSQFFDENVEFGPNCFVAKYL